MAIHLFSALANDSVLAFDPALDILRFDDSAISARSVVLDFGAGGSPVAFNAAGKTIYLAATVSVTMLTPVNISFADGSRLIVGDGTLAANDALANLLVGGSGDDQLVGLGGNDTLAGGDGADWIDGGADADAMFGGLGADTYGVDADADRVVERPTTNVQIVSTNAAGALANGASLDAKFSADGRFVVFASAASNLVAGDSNAVADIFVKNLETGAVTRVSRAAGGAQANGESANASFTPDGGRVGFHSQASSLVTGDGNGSWDVFVKNLATGAVVRASTSAAGVEGNGHSFNPWFASDGNRVAFESNSTNLVAGDSNGAYDIFVKDLASGAIQRVSTGAAGAQADGGSFGARFSADGRFVAFQSQATNLVVGDTNGVVDIFVKDLVSGAIQRVSTGSTGAQGNGNCSNASLSADGRYVAFTSDASNLVANDTNGAADVFVKDLTTGVTTRASLADAGLQADSGSELARFSPDGRWLVFYSGAGNLVFGDANVAWDVYVRDMQTQQVRRVSVDVAGNGGDAGSHLAAFSPDGTRIVFDSFATNLVAGDANGQRDVMIAANPFVADAARDAVHATTARYALPDGVENLVLAAGNDGFGNALANAITGNGGANVLVGSDGADTLDGLGGADTLRGGRGADTYVVDHAGDRVDDAPTPEARWASQAANGTQGNLLSGDPALSASGRWIAFGSLSSDLVPGDTNGVADIFLRDFASGALRLVSTNAGGTPGNGGSANAQIAPDAASLLFESAASNLLAGDANGASDVFVKDLASGAVRLASSSASGVQGNGGSFTARWSADGARVVFASDASNLVAGDANALRDIFVKTLAGGAIERVSTGASGAAANGASDNAGFSADGRFVVFESVATNLVASADNNNRSDIFVKNLATGALRRASESAGGVVGNGASFNAQLSADGRFAVFESAASNLVAGDSNGRTDIFVKDLASGAVQRVSTSETGAQASGPSYGARISADGRFVLFVSDAPNLVAGDTNTSSDVFVKDLASGALRCVSIDALGQPGSYDSFQAAFSADAREIAFTTAASNIVPGMVRVDFETVRVANPFWADGAIDTVRASVNFALPDAVENLVLTGTPAIRGAGNSLANRITGNGGDNALGGGLGNDTLDGGAGADTLRGGAGRDTYVVDDAGDVVVESEQFGPVLASVAPGGGPLPGVGGVLGSLSGDGRTLTFDAHATAVYHKDLDTGALRLVSTAAPDTLPRQGSDARVSADGRYVVYRALGDYVQFDNNDTSDVYLRDMATGSVHHLSASLTAATENGSSQAPDISDDGRIVVFDTVASNLGVADRNGWIDVVAKDLATGALRIVSATAAGDQGNGHSLAPRVSADGRFVAFQSFASNLAANDGNGARDVFVKDLATGALHLVSANEAGEVGNDSLAGSLGAALSADGRYVVFESNASNLVDADTNGATDVFVRDLHTGALRRVSVGAGGGQGNGTSAAADISSDGRFVVFVGNASNLVAGDTNAGFDVFVKDLLTGAVQRVNVDSAGGQVASASFGRPGFSADGRFVVFESNSDRLVHPEGETGYDLFRVPNPFIGDGAVDTVRTAVGYTLPEGVENLVLTGSGAIDGSGNALANSLVGNGAANLFNGHDGNDTIDGGAGGDTLRGGPGDDLYLVDAAADVVLEYDGVDAVRLSLSGATQGSGASTGGSVSADGHWLVFTSSAANLVLVDSNASADVFVRNLATGALSRVSTAGGGAQADGASGNGSLDATGRVVLFDSAAGNLVEGDTNGAADVFVKVLASGVVTLVSAGAEGEPADGASRGACFAPDGRRVLFESDAGNLVAGDGNSRTDLFVRDLASGAVERVSTTASGAQANGHSLGASFAGDSGAIVFSSLASNLVGGDSNALADIFVKDLETGVVQRVSTSSAGAQANGASRAAQASADGRKVLFESDAGNLVAGDSNAATDLFVKDLDSGAITRVSTGAGGVQGDGASSGGAISADGRWVAFVSTASNLVAGDSNGVADVFVKELDSGAIRRVTVDYAGGQANGASSEVRFAPGGATLLITTTASNLVAGDGNAAADVVQVRNPFVGSGGGNDTVRASADYTLPGNAENLVLTGSAAIDGTGNALANRIVGNAEANVIDGKAGADTLAGGAGDDVYAVDHAGDRVDEALGNGSDTVLAAVSHTLRANVERLTLTGTAAIDGNGNSMGNLLKGNGGANRLAGGAGADTIDGALGNDTFSGGAGADAFRFVTAASAANRDTVADFVAADDRVELGRSVFASIGSTGALAASAFRANASGTAADADDRIVYHTGTGALLYDADGIGAVAAVWFATLAGAPVITAADFLIV
jgi:Tol biopolymer transport system component